MHRFLRRHRLLPYTGSASGVSPGGTVGLSHVPLRESVLAAACLVRPVAWRYPARRPDKHRSKRSRIISAHEANQRILGRLLWRTTTPRGADHRQILLRASTSSQLFHVGGKFGGLFCAAVACSIEGRMIRHYSFIHMHPRSASNLDNTYYLVLWSPPAPTSCSFSSSQDMLPIALFLAHRHVALSPFAVGRQVVLLDTSAPYVFRYRQCDRVGATTRATGGRGKRSSGASTMEVHGGVGSATYSPEQTLPIIPIHHSSARICGQTFQETREPSI